MRKSKLGWVGPGSGSVISMVPVNGDDPARNGVILPKTPGNSKDASGLCSQVQCCEFFFNSTKGEIDWQGSRSGFPA